MGPLSAQYLVQERNQKGPEGIWVTLKKAHLASKSNLRFKTCNHSRGHIYDWIFMSQIRNLYRNDI